MTSEKENAMIYQYAAQRGCKSLPVFHGRKQVTEAGE
ncbi:hypothetical protein CLOBOL_03839 [Enterocloster bolteae ATCC BAA-613]|uniref:Uncharacterized protein n=1 Tax=Enterocloster bolteae (strain ATCC BAA-613 / DSM 15670 / CCUG 46953 / JCM 12243 / WAL 16351) TaxID=411902 RepID=A8RTZ0_ENTBW|nr:hypothetical protein CLOBOL_03839 [Enterocloster bolteae ATCC BAA-613]